MKSSLVIVVAVSWLLEEASHLVGAAKVNIDDIAFEGGVLLVPENQLEGEIKANLSEAVNTTKAIVECYSLESGSGFTTLEFRNSMAPVGTTNVIVWFRVVAPGRTITIQCTAQSEGNNTQYTLSASRGNYRLLRVTKAPTVVICPSIILLHKYQLQSSFEVRFSEKIAGFPVVVQCSSVEAESDAAPQLQLNFEETFVDINQNTAQVPYTIKSHGVPVLVTCRARSANMSRPVVSTTQLASSATVSANNSLALQAATRSLNGTVTVTPAVSGSASYSPESSAVVSSVGGGGGGGSSRRRRRRSLGASSSNRTTFQYLYNNSAGPPVTFALDVSPLRILPPVGFIRAPNGIFRTVLALDQPAENTVDVTCSLETLPPGSDISNTTEVCSSPPADTVMFANSSVKLKLTAKEIQFEKGELFKKIDLTLSGSPAGRTGSLVRVVCCGKDTGVSLRYNNESAVVFVWVELRKLQAVDWDRITSDQRTTTSESDIDLECPCNLKENSCDVGCCCDQDCNDYEQTSSSCIPGFFGGASSERPFEFSCQATWPDSTDWQPLLCVTINNSPVIGYFYNFSSPPSAQDTLSFSTLEERKTRSRFSFSESEERSAFISSSLYLAGTTIKTAANTDEPSYARAVLGELSLPQGVFTRLCSQTTPVRFLEEFASGCVHELEESLCSSSSAVSALNYLMPINLNQPGCPLPSAVLAEGRLNETLGGPPKLASTEVRYFCIDINKYVSMTTEGSDDTRMNDTTSLFKSISPDTDSAERCEFDDGQTKPPAPEFNTTTRLCSNVVVKVEYEFSWQGTQVTEVLARVSLGNVKIPAIQVNAGLATSQIPTHTLSQSFSVKFRHSAQNSSSSGQKTAQRSGNPGYVRGRPVLSRLVTNSTQALPAKIHLWSPAGDSLCAESLSTPVLFGVDTFSGCLLQLSLEDLRNCTQLRQLVWTNQGRLLQASHVGRRGNADQAVADDWLPIVREPFNSTTNETLDNGICRGIPSGVLIEMLVSEAGKFRGVPQMEVVGTRISYQYTTWKFQCKSGSGVSCFLPASNRTNTSFTSVVPSPSVTITPSHSLVNQSVANVSVSMSTFLGNQNTSPDDETDNKTRSYGSRFQYFLVSTSVVFIKVPSEKPARVKRSLDQTGICYHDVCKEELFLPLTEAYTGEPRQKAMALSLFLIFLSLVIFTMTRPWG